MNQPRDDKLSRYYASGSGLDSFDAGGAGSKSS